MNILIIEDEKLTADKLALMLTDLNSDYSIVGNLQSIKQSVSWLQNNKADLIFLDIELSDGLAFEIFEEISITIPVIFTTAYNQYAIKAFELNSIDYLLKPINKKDLENSLLKYNSLKQFFSQNNQINEILKLIHKQTEKRNRFAINIGKKIVSIEIDEIAYFFAENEAIYICTKGKKKYLIPDSLDKIETEISSDKFFRINRQFIISLSSIENMSYYSKSRLKINLIPQFEKDVFVSIKKLSPFKNWLNGKY